LGKVLNRIAVEGPIGAGKTALAIKIAERIKGEPVLERIEDNPFIENFYKEMRGYAFQTQLFFLFQRHQKERMIAQGDLFKDKIVTDFFFERDRVYAYLNLDENELLLYEKIYNFLKRDIIAPDLVVYLQTKPEILYKRVQNSKRPWEREISLEYLKALCDAYNRFFFQYNSSALLIVNPEGMDFINNSTHFDALMKEILSTSSEKRFYSYG